MYARKFVNKNMEVEFMYIYSADRHDRPAESPLTRREQLSLVTATASQWHQSRYYYNYIFRLKYENKIILTYNVIFFNENPEVF